MKINRLLTFLVFSYFLSFTSMLNAEVFRVYNTQVVTMSENFQAEKISIGISDALAVFLPEDCTFLQGIAFEVKIPKIVAGYYGSIAYSIYKDVTPKPKVGNIDYSGNRLDFDTFPARLSYNIQVPLRKTHTIKQNPYSVLLSPLSLEEGFVFLRLQQVMKGTPAEFFTAMFDIVIQPIFINEGLLHLEIIKPAGLEGCFIVYIDEKEVLDYEKGVFLKEGLHHLSVISETFRNEVRTLTVQKAQHTRLTIELKDIAPTIQIIAPENTLVELDGIAVKEFAKPMVVSEGEHLVKLSVGNYETIRTVKAVNGKSYTVSLSVDVNITEE
ncbi:MAG: hypothetical protein GX220_01435 [Treponema sp.]|nr:hypothetical protein [Treponema sp.]